jgi:hypothetical protein
VELLERTSALRDLSRYVTEAAAAARAAQLLSPERP